MKTIPTLFLCATVGVTLAWGAQAASTDASQESFPLARFVFKAISNEVDLTDTQIQQGKEIARQHQAAISPLVDRLAVERKVLRDLSLASPLNEGAIRTQIVKMQPLQAELIVETAKLRSDLRKLLTPEQATKADGIRARIEGKSEKARSFFRDWLAAE